MTSVDVYLAAVGLTAIITFSRVGDLVANALDPEGKFPPMRCPQCVGFWSGLVVGLLVGQGLQALLTGFAVSILSRVAASLVERLER